MAIFRKTSEFFYSLGPSAKHKNRTFFNCNGNEQKYISCLHLLTEQGKVMFQRL